jgi:hypothetical protein
MQGGWQHIGNPSRAAGSLRRRRWWSFCCCCCWNWHLDATSTRSVRPTCGQSETSCRPAIDITHRTANVVSVCCDVSSSVTATILQASGVRCSSCPRLSPLSPSHSHSHRVRQSVSSDTESVCLQPTNHARLDTRDDVTASQPLLQTTGLVLGHRAEERRTIYCSSPDSLRRAYVRCIRQDRKPCDGTGSEIAALCSGAAIGRRSMHQRCRGNRRKSTKSRRLRSRPASVCMPTIASSEPQNHYAAVAILAPSNDLWPNRRRLRRRDKHNWYTLFAIWRLLFLELVWLQSVRRWQCKLPVEET